MNREGDLEARAAGRAPLFSIERVTIGYDGVPVLREVSLTIARGECVALLGPNGSGKTTLFKTILGILRPIAGAIHWHDAEPVRFGYVPQRERLDSIFPVSVREVVRMGGYRRLRPLAPLPEASAAAVAAALASVGATGWEGRLFNQLSGGERQRVLIARALVSQPTVLLLDEPTSGVDLTSEATIISLVKHLLANDLSIVMVSHNLSTVEQLADRVVWVHHGRLVTGSADEMLTPEHIRQMLVPEAPQEPAGGCVPPGAFKGAGFRR